MEKNKEEESHYYMMNEKKEKYVKNIEIIEYNMDKIMEYWYTLDKKNIERYKHLIMLDLKEEELEKIAKGDSFIMEYEEKVVDLNNEETFQSAMSYEEDQKFILNTEKKLALEEGRKLGAREEKIQLAKNMLNDGMPIAQIQKYTGLTQEEIMK